MTEHFSTETPEFEFERDDEHDLVILNMWAKGITVFFVADEWGKFLHELDQWTKPGFGQP